MKIAFVTPGYYPFLGGIETLVQAIAESLASQNHQIDILTFDKTKELLAEEYINGVHVRRFKEHTPGNMFCVGFSLLPYLQRHGYEYDIINAHNYHAMPIYWSSLACADRLVVSPHYHGKGHSKLANLLHLFYRPFGGWAVRRAQKIICASEFEKKLVQKHFRVENGIEIIPDGIYLKSLRSTDQIEIDRPALLYVGRLEHYKRVDLIIEALAHLPNYCKLYIIGKGPEEGPLQQQAVRLRVSDRVVFLKNVPNDMLFRWYRSAQALVMMSEAESFPMTCIEALAAGCRVVCSARPPFIELAARFPEAVSLISDASPSSLASSIQNTVGLPGRVNVDLSIYDWNSIAADTLRVFREATPSHPEVNT